ncbi:PDZ domain-containing protein [Oceanobacillus sp. CAU 1775]
MVEDWLLEVGKGVGRLFLNPLFYWGIFILFLVGYRRIKQERYHFGRKIFGLFSEIRHTLLPSLIFGLLFSVIILGAGVIFSVDSLIMLVIAIIILSLSMRFSLLSASYTIGLAYILLLFAPIIVENIDTIDNNMFSETNYLALSLLLGFMLLVESYFLKQTKRKSTYPNLVLSDRGYWIGNHYIKKLGIIPIFLLVPGGLIESFAPYWPLFSIGEGSYGIVLFPFVLGISQKVTGSLAPIAGKMLSKKLMMVGILVILVSVLGLYVNGMSLVALLIGLLGREFIIYRFRLQDKQKRPYFQPHARGTRVLAIINDSPAERLEILPGEIISKVNDRKISNADEFYEALQGNGAYFKLEVLDDNEEVRFVQGAFYEGDHHKLGLIFVKEPFKLIAKN